MTIESFRATVCAEKVACGYSRAADGEHPRKHSPTRSLIDFFDSSLKNSMLTPNEKTTARGGNGEVGIKTKRTKPLKDAGQYAGCCNEYPNQSEAVSRG
jgi:hypothetical protein